MYSKYCALILLLAAIGSTPKTLAAVYRVNNNYPTDFGQKRFNSLSDANTDNRVLAGDTLMVEGSSISYLGVTLGKPLVIIGTGYFLTENPKTQASPLMSMIQNITVSAPASGTVLMGLVFASGSTSFTPYIAAGNVIIMRCYLTSSIDIISAVSNIQVLDNYFTGDALYLGSSAYVFTGMVFRNNIVLGGINVPSASDYQRIFSALDNNIIGGPVTATSSSFRSNVLTNKTAALSISSGSIQNNLLAGTQLTGNGNQTVDTAQLFVGAAGNSTDGRYRLKDNSAYKTAGYGNTEPGIFGGSQPYVLSGLPPLPSIYELNADGYVNQTGGLSISVKAKTNP